MFNKQKKVTVKFSHESEGFSGTSTSIPLNEGKLVEYLKDSLDRHGQVVIRHISDDNEMVVTTSRTMEYRDKEGRIEELNEVIRSYINSQAISMESHAVFVNGVLKGVFGNEAHARLKKSNLISKGASEESVSIKPLQINSFQDFEA
ncbi:hypothetical protein CVD28_00430 [Bacillus sp. M6-12]|uniref:hypothetical protein n=1 Tax=Bacillus sp. M6-12 TaxID=2054166 RepID=UPI000C77A020|nr:hypothetical protein [Bacillus sp. M6-12]PLS18901.1 hypothetical protein CVD28_00430 [Bacillus sp. M6-12]